MTNEKTNGLADDSRMGHYRIVSKIGAGGMGEVYLANDTKLDRKVALKILPPEFAEDADRMSRFIREAKSASALNHPNIITIHEIGEADGTHFIATEFIDGKTLSDYAKSNSLNYKSALEIAIQVASALDEAHLAGIVHRDIKPDNVMVRKNGLVKILDFGIAKLSAPISTDEEAVTAIKGGTSPGMQKSIEYFQQAIAIDPGYALAFAGLADAYALLSAYGGPAREATPKGREAGLKALSLDNNLAEAHAALGIILFEYDYDFAAAEREFWIDNKCRNNSTPREAHRD